MKKILNIVIPAAVLIIIFLSTAFSNFTISGEDYIADIGGEKVTKAEYMIMLQVQRDKLLAENNKLEQNEKREFWKTRLDGKLPADIVKDSTLDKIKEMKIQLIKARENSIFPDKGDEDKARAYVDDLKLGLSGSKDGDVLEAEFIKKFGVTGKEYEAVYKEVLLIRKLVAGEAEKMQISEEEIKSYYDKYKDELDNYTVRDILFATVDLETSEALSDDKVREAQRRAVETLNKAKAGADLEALAIDNSDDPDVETNKGLYTFKIQAQNKNEIDDWALKAKAGDMAIVQTFYGYHVVKLEKRSAYDEVKSDAREVLFEGKYLELLDSWKKEAKYSVNIKNQKYLDSMDKLIEE